MKLKRKIYSTVLFGLLSILLVGAVLGSVTTIDPEGDSEISGSEGTDQVYKDNVDILKVSIDTGKDPMEIQLQVKGKVIDEASDDYLYTYRIKFWAEEVEIGGLGWTSSTNPYYSNSDLYVNDSLVITGFNTSTVTILLEREHLDVENLTEITADALVNVWPLDMAGDNAPDEEDDTDTDTDTDNDTDSDSDTDNDTDSDDEEDEKEPICGSIFILPLALITGLLFLLKIRK